MRRSATPARVLGLGLGLALAAALPATARAVVAVPPLTGAVVDQAGLLSGEGARRLESLAVAARGSGGQGIQLQYVIIPSLEGEAIEDFSIRVAEAWKLGTRQADNGVLVAVAVQDRAVRIEVGGGLEGGLTDAQSSRIVRGTITPAFQAGRYGDGLYDAGVQILGALGALPSGIQPTRTQRPATRFSALGLVGLFMLMFVFRVLSGFGPRRRRSLWSAGGPFIAGGWGGGRGGFGGFGGGGGGWSGGGGGFSGGGASGRW
jgi:uncharacterized protein